jgi:hypothetical protein
MAPLNGEAFAIDAADVHTFIVNFISGNETAEAKIQAYETNNNGRLDYIALREHYEGVGLHSLDITKAETAKYLKDLFQLTPSMDSFLTGCCKGNEIR